MPDIVVPHSREAEESVIGSLLISPNIFGEVSSIFDPGDFYLDRNRFVWDAVASLYERGIVIDFVTVSEELKNQGHLADIGGPAFITSLISNTPTSAHVMTYLDIIRESAVRRGMLASANRIVKLAYSEDIPLGQCVSEAEAEVQRIVHGSDSIRGTGLTPGEINNEFKESLESGFGALKIGIPELDDALGGLFPSEVIVIASRPGCGKTALCLQIARTVAFGKKRVLFVSLEMQRMQLWARMVVPASGLDWRDVRMGQITSVDKVLLGDLSDRLMESLTSEESGEPYLIVDDTPGATLFDIRRSVAYYEPDLIIVDQLPDLKCHVPNMRRVEWYGEAMQFFHADIARKFGVPLIIVAQINRAVEGRQDKRPMASDLRDSGEIEQRADIVLLGYREDMYEGRETEVVVPIEWDVAKHRQGNTATTIIMPYDLQAQWFGG